MKRLDFVLPDFTRKAWVSARAAKVWQTRLDHINGAWTRIERWSVVEGARGSCLTFIEPQHLTELVRWASEYGVLVLPMARVGVSDQYSATPKAVVDGKSWQYRVVICRPELRDAWYAAWEDDGNEGRYAGTQNARIGELLGFPKCCRRFFDEEWIEKKSIDTTWAMAVNSSYALRQNLSRMLEGLDERTVQVDGFPEANILLRWLGVRSVAHLPCSFNCAETVEVAKLLEQVGRDRHFGEILDWSREMLAWPVEWTALHGIAEIRTPVIKVSTRTDATAEKYTVQRHGSSYPEEGAQGLAFPFQANPAKVQLTRSPAFARAFKPYPLEINELDMAAVGLEVRVNPEVEERSELLASLWTDNGFASSKAMNEAHDVVLEATPITILKAGDTVLDLGCGNGRLLERLGELVPGLRMYGIELDPERCRRAGERLREVGNTEIAIYEGSIFDAGLWIEAMYDLVFFTPGRILELRDGGVRASTLRGLLRLCRCIVFYAYGDWLEDGGILELLHRAELNEGWELLGEVESSSNAQAILARRR